ncbi:maleylpyruvate isomerase family mycothiol-dependent enzyme [Rothia nasisuis]|uniref:maleylpyruvate isomerase family mycothiol-dependent enzyme n=1 Tax=Rothia nasisuis TaxID=2109647 RepID=UPI001F00482F|nr:maleylpyruvate isomerase family mycothiol-dependent enzyme [Rothia nasisuis]
MLTRGRPPPTLCEGWETRHLAAHLLLRESKPTLAAGVMGGPLGARTERATNQLADELAGLRRYEKALRDFETLPGYLHMRSHLPGMDEAMNLIEYFVHTEDVRRVSPADGEELAPRVLAEGVQEKIWQLLRARARMMAGKKYPDGLVLEAPGYSPAVHTALAPPAGRVATVLTGEPGELVLYLFGREAAARVEVG